MFPCRSARVQEKTQQPPTPNWGSLRHGRAPKHCGVSRDGKYLFSIPRYGAVLGWGVYISEHLWNTPRCEPPPGDKQSMMNGGPFCIIIQGGLFMDLCHPATRQMLKIRRLGIELPTVTEIQRSGHTCGK